MEEDIQVLGENNSDIITYSKSLPVVVSRACRNNCPYCGFHRKDNLVVPYSIIKTVKAARMNGVREIYFCAGERPDRFPDVRATLDLWGFDSYVDYLYTMCELAFLEGLIPVLNVGFLSLPEMKKMSEIAALAKIMLDAVDPALMAKIHADSPGKSLGLRVKSLVWAGKLNWPVVTGFVVGLGETKKYRKEMLQLIANLHKEYGHIHEVSLQNFFAYPGLNFKYGKVPAKEEMLKTVDMALNILPEDIKVTVPVEFNPEIEDFVKLGIKDLGRVFEAPKVLFPKVNPVNVNDLKLKVTDLGFDLQQRFPLGFDWIKKGSYSRKLGQIFDALKYKIKKDEQEKSKGGIR
ncbi:7,8-didemethyl-8-hydroxy-5-deazariboflavin synthase subunit CofG [bacterium]|nr:7,8-didemethyl-8-hydroxy-5-deazariboflavin synthase subunit CofG [bacterium]MBT3581300.1 7,8-didemethyl-8-hydroxy-5-deazariboflavin synthase subunit CofG [bacterium]MBT4552120.1 7,8-didemethyl-8-hydroxy-5-deazariboflavin synthase subunit CofG [bacterium]MBT5988645.1 7,8-didemethyl-8-hydroxy-5-deazariboflavin synthase subunit CofG [bacterium]